MPFLESTSPQCEYLRLQRSEYLFIYVRITVSNWSPPSLHNQCTSKHGILFFKYSLAEEVTITAFDCNYTRNTCYRKSRRIPAPNLILDQLWKVLIFIDLNCGMNWLCRQLTNRLLVQPDLKNEQLFLRESRSCKRAQ